MPCMPHNHAFFLDNRSSMPTAFSLAARIKSFSVRPSRECVHSSTRSLFHPCAAIYVLKVVLKLVMHFLCLCDQRLTTDSVSHEVRSASLLRGKLRRLAHREVEVRVMLFFLGHSSKALAQLDGLPSAQQRLVSAQA